MSSCENKQVNMSKILRDDWRAEEIKSFFNLPFNDLLYKAQTTHRVYFDPNEIQLSTLINIKSGGCPEDCAYCPQSIRYETGAEVSPLMDLQEVVDAAEAAKKNGASRFCMGAAWRSPKQKDIEKIHQIIKAVKHTGLETCATLGMLTDDQAVGLKEAGLDYYNHNLDTSPEFYKKIITTREYNDRLKTLASVRSANLKVCCGGIIGMGESIDDRVGLLMALANMSPHPESVPINMLVKVHGTPLENIEEGNGFDMVRIISVARILMPKAYIRLSAGRSDMSDELQALCFMGGANSVFFGEKLLTTDNPQRVHDLELFSQLGLRQSVLRA
jgi:biotin synthase